MLQPSPKRTSNPPLPVPTEIDARHDRHGQRHKAVNLPAIRLAAMILAPCRFLREADEVRAGDMVMMANLRPAHAAKEAFRIIRMRLRFVAEAICFLMIDPMQRVASVQFVPGAGFVGVYFGLGRYSLADKRESVSLIAEDAGQRFAAALADHDHDFALARLVHSQSPVTPVLPQVCRLDVPAEIAAVNLCLAARTADVRATALG
jgi:hypothetical protein